MNKLNIFLGGIMIGIMIGMLIIFLTLIFESDTEPVKKIETYENMVSELKIGDIYIDSLFNENPFKVTKIDTIEIIDIKTNYIKYYSSFSQDTTSMRMDFFISLYK